MRILIAHNHYQQAGGEDTVAQSEYNLLKDFGHEVYYYQSYNRDIESTSIPGKISILFKALWSKSSYSHMRMVIREFKPDIVHFHNIFFILTPSVYKACRDEGVPVVQSLHNFRLICPNGLFLRDGKICEDCAKEKNFRKSIIYRCYKESRAITLILAAIISYHWARKTWLKMIDVYVMATEFGREKYIRSGLEADKIIVKPNIIYPNILKKDRDNGYALYAGRLSQEKGIEVLLLAWKKIKGFRLKIVGAGHLLNNLKEFVVNEGIENVEFLGFLPKKRLYSIYARC